MFPELPGWASRQRSRRSSLGQRTDFTSSFQTRPKRRTTTGVKRDFYRAVASPPEPCRAVIRGHPLGVGSLLTAYRLTMAEPPRGCSESFSESKMLP